VPGLFARIRVVAEERPDAIVVPDRAVQQQLGRYFVTVVGADNKAEARPVKLGPRLGTSWVIEDGVKPGDKLVVEGLQKALPGTPLNPVVVSEAELQANPPAASG
jgi:membrane fusion protein (multidrug efflux system)